MSEFAFLFRGRDTTASPEQMQRTMEKWTVWFKQIEGQGRLREPGHPLEHAGRVIKGRERIVTDGPFAEAKDVIGGYIVIEAKDLDHAAELAQGCPIFDVGGSVEVRPIERI
ncbi:hypothetical protein DYQ86_17825 [Acidobacteria bacterium AB60]|nr:hypothetical protein DYQ86_17825 [Acidobacteria bacterium AB60]